MTAETRKLVELYLENEKLVFETWYTKIVSKEIGIEEGELTGALPPLEDIVFKFKKWCGDNYKLLKKIVCEDFDYPGKKDTIRNAIDLAILLVPFVENKVDFPYEVVAILILLGCDKLCAEIGVNG